MELFDKTIDKLSTQVEFRAQRHKVIVSNVTNLDVVDYESKDLTFSQELGEALDKSGRLVKTDPRHLAGTAGTGSQEIVPTGGRPKIDQEMVNLAENQLMYNLSIELLSRKFRGLNTVLKEAK